MSLTINGKKFMNISEAVQWLLDNNALPFQSTANYVADTVIAKTTIINPSPAEIRIGSLVLFADSKVGTVSAINDAGFMVGQDYTDIGSKLNQITSIDIDASRHLIFTLSNGATIDAGLVKEVSSFSIDASQHLIVYYNDGTSQDLGAIFSGNVTISGDLDVSGTITGVKIENIKDAAGHSRFVEGNGTSGALTGLNITYNKWSLSGTHLLLVVAGTVDNGVEIPDGFGLSSFDLPAWVRNKIYAVWGGTRIESKTIPMRDSSWSSQNITGVLTLTSLGVKVDIIGAVTLTSQKGFRFQFDLLIDDN